MREVKFRGKNPDGYWVEGDLIHKALTVQSMEVDCGIAEERCYPIEVIPETVGQFTGLMDKNGKEIYEGDIVKETYHILNQVETRTEIISYYNQSFNVPSDGEIEVIGNIHDNPELLESDK